MKRIADQQSLVPWMDEMKSYLKGEESLETKEKYKRLSAKATEYVLDEWDVLYKLTLSARQKKLKDTEAKDQENCDLRLVVPDVLRDELIHAMHDEMVGGHQGVLKTYEKLKKKYFWPGMFADTERYIHSCLDCQSGNGKPAKRAKSKGNLVATYPMEILAMDILGPFPETGRGNSYVIVFVDLFSGYVSAGVMRYQETTAEDCARLFEELIYNRFGACRILRHDRDPRFMSEFFQYFNKSIGQKQRATLSYRPAANGHAERNIQTVTRILKMYCLDPEQLDWDLHVVKVALAINTSYNVTRHETPFHLLHGFDPLTPMEAMTVKYLHAGKDKNAKQWRRKKQRIWQYVRAYVIEALNKVQETRIQRSEDVAKGEPFEEGDCVWVYIPKVKEGFNRKLAHLWHGPWRIQKKLDDQVYELDVSNEKWKIYAKVHFNRMKKFCGRMSRPKTILEIPV